MKIEKIKTVFEDDRGDIADIFYKSDINHVAIINSKKRAIRGNHYHKKSTQHLYVIKGSLKYYSKMIDKEEIENTVVKEGEMITSPPFEIHAMEMLEDTQCIVFTEGLRGGKDFEKDTFRVKII